MLRTTIGAVKKDRSRMVDRQAESRASQDQAKGKPARLKRELPRPVRHLAVSNEREQLKTGLAS